MVGMSIFAKLAEEGLNVLAVTNQEQMNYLDIMQRSPLLQEKREFCDFSQTSQIEQLCDHYGVPDILVHAGWGGMTEPQSQIHLEENVTNTSMLMSTLYGLGLKKFIFLGSIDEYGQRDGELSEGSKPVGNLTNYALGKCQVSEIGIRESERRSAIYIHVRLANCFGAPQRENSLIRTLHTAYKNNKGPQLSPCQNFRDYIHTSDASEGIRRICDIGHSTTVNLGSGRSIQLKNFVEKYWNELGGAADKLSFGAPDSGEQQKQNPRPFMDLSKLVELTKWKPSVSIDEGIRLTAAAINS